MGNSMLGGGGVSPMNYLTLKTSPFLDYYFMKEILTKNTNY